MTSTNDNSALGEQLHELRCTDSVRKVFAHITNETSRRHIGGLLPDLIVLWALLRSERKLAVAMLEACGIDISEMLADASAKLDALPSKDQPQNVDNRSIASLLPKAHAISARMGHNYVGTEHVLLALCESTDADVCEILRQRGVSLESLTEALSSLLRHEATTR